MGGAVSIASLTTDAGGGTAINGGSVTTSGAQSYGDTVSLGTATTLTGTTGDFAAIAGGGSDLTLAFSGATNIAGTVSGVANLTTNAGGTTRFGDGTVTTSGAQTFNDQILLGVATVFSGTAGTFAAGLVGNGFDVTLSYSASSSLTGAFTGIDDLVIDGGNTTALSGSIATVGGQTYSDAITLAGATTLSSSNAGAIAFQSTVNGPQALTVNTGGTTSFAAAVGVGTSLASLTTDAGGTTAINGGFVTTSGSQSFGDQVSLGANTTLIGTTGSFTPGVLGNGNDLTLNYSGVSAIDGGFTGIANLTTDAVGTTQLAGMITTSGSQTYSDAVVLTGDATLASSGNAALTLGSSVNGGFALTANTTGTTTFSGAVGAGIALTSLTTNTGGTTAINGGAITTSGAQSFGDQVSLGANTTLTGGSGSFAMGLIGNGFDLTLDFGGTTTLDSGFTGVRNLATGNGGATTLSGTISTSGTQTYNDIVSLLGATTLASSGVGATGNIAFVATLDGAQALTANTAGTTSFGGAVGAGTALASLTTNAGGSTAINGGAINTTGAQSYNDAVTLGATTVLTSTATGNIAFATTLDGARSLTVNTAGITSFGGPVGGTDALVSLTTDGAGSTAINGGAINTTGAQSYNDAVTLGAGTTLTSTGSGAITLGSTVNGAQALAVNTAGITTFLGTVGAGTALASLTTDAAGTTDLNGGTVITSGAQTYNDAVVLSADTTLSAGGNIGFATTVDSDTTARALTVNTSAATTFGGWSAAARLWLR
ncbi:hypothetical protein [Novosphingobium sp. Gsoil 351]|uniref:beta strand repeat-containing protein n=1 Tax=Novosphingobium sp. Gsoil 351 TaxID=2675225 RepID=UPI0012B46BC1|nr:hypothetical protein [Novosphingobium sp. Gsoil 351]QGN55300.1 hypothetical protein GKE62_12855 [Novosphingobium sp. Gsoil 351]